ncbi:MAG: hypothetical protein A2X86_05765 [Bdellovibrionales bacterium GWA2_49_15]|nr:MAG: hypothetical protein A2X86_05765 [Bdellovibrionales bacterium GWA2_49_15]
MKISVLFPFLLIILCMNFAYGVELKSIKFYQKGEVSNLEMMVDNEDLKMNKFHVSEDKQIIIDLKDTTASEKVVRAFDTSEFSGAVVFVSAYKKPNTPSDLRIAIQLRENVRSKVARKGNMITLEIENRFGVFNQSAIETSQTYEEKINDKELGKIHVPKSESVEDILENLTFAGRKKYIGKKITINVKDLSVEDLLKIIADASGFNIIISEEVKKLPPMTLALTNIAWDQSLDTILGLNKLVAMKNGIILMVTSLEKATAEKKLEIDAKKMVEAEEPLVTKIFGISFASIDDMKNILAEYLTKERGKISMDSRTNSLIVKDVPDVVEKMRKIIEALDTQTPQVLIESKIVEVREAYAKSIGFQNGLSFGYDPVGSLPLGTEAAIGIGGTLTRGTIGPNAGPGFTFSSAPSQNSPSIFGINIARMNRVFDLSFTLAMMEQESKGKVISSPKVITQNKKKAEINSKDTTSFAVVTGIGDARTSSFEEVDAKLKLEVTPQVTNEGSISMEISLSKEEFGDRPSEEAPPNKAQREVKTNVLVDNGSTIVIGGIYNYTKTESHSGIPFLKDIPLLGWLFRTPYAPLTTKNEMIIFLTPRIINQEEAGLTADRT